MTTIGSQNSYIANVTAGGNSIIAEKDQRSNVEVAPVVLAENTEIVENRDNVALSQKAVGMLGLDRTSFDEGVTVDSEYVGNSGNSNAGSSGTDVSETSDNALDTTELGNEADVGGAGVDTDGCMTVLQMKKAVAEARGISKDDVIVVSGTGRGDEISVTAGDNGGICVNINGKEYNYTAEEASRLIINGGAGDDNIFVDEAVVNDLIIMGGSGDDTIQGGSGNDTIVGGNGNDTLKGGRGNDRITDDKGINSIYGEEGNDVLIAHSETTDKSGTRAFSNYVYGGDGKDYIEGGNGRDFLDGGDGYDAIYGLGGNDSIYGGSGDDYLDGGSGDDFINGGVGNDNLVGGKGNDTLYGNSGDDLLVGCSGEDKVHGGVGSDRVITDGEDDVTSDSDDAEVEVVETIDIPDNFRVIGNEYEKERIGSDMEFLASTKQGHQLLTEIANTGHKVEIRATSEGSRCSAHTSTWSDPTQGSDSCVYYNTTKMALSGMRIDADYAPVIALYHEMCHSYNAATGTVNTNYYDKTTGEQVDAGTSGSAMGAEWQAVGLDNDDVQANPEYINENSMRELLGFWRRSRY